MIPGLLEQDRARLEGVDYRGTFVIATHDRQLLTTIGTTRTIDLRGFA